jgi:mannose-6-phosphate isomerase class I
VVDRFDIKAGDAVSLADVTGVSECVVCLKGSGTVTSSEGAVELSIGEAVVVPAKASDVKVKAETELTLFRCFEPRHE